MAEKKVIKIEVEAPGWSLVTVPVALLQQYTNWKSLTNRLNNLLSLSHSCWGYQKLRNRTYPILACSCICIFSFFSKTILNMACSSSDNACFLEDANISCW